MAKNNGMKPTPPPSIRRKGKQPKDTYKPPKTPEFKAPKRRRKKFPEAEGISRTVPYGYEPVEKPSPGTPTEQQFYPGSRFTQSIYYPEYNKLRKRILSYISRNNLYGQLKNLDFEIPVRPSVLVEYSDIEQLQRYYAQLRDMVESGELSKKTPKAEYMRARNALLSYLRKYPHLKGDDTIPPSPSSLIKELQIIEETENAKQLLNKYKGMRKDELDLMKFFGMIKVSENARHKEYQKIRKNILSYLRKYPFLKDDDIPQPNLNPTDDDIQSARNYLNRLKELGKEFRADISRIPDVNEWDSNIQPYLSDEQIKKFREENGIEFEGEASTLKEIKPDDIEKEIAQISPDEIQEYDDKVRDVSDPDSPNYDTSSPYYYPRSDEFADPTDYDDINERYNKGEISWDDAVNKAEDRKRDKDITEKVISDVDYYIEKADLSPWGDGSWFPDPEETLDRSIQWRDVETLKKNLPERKDIVLKVFENEIRNWQPDPHWSEFFAEQKRRDRSKAENIFNGAINALGEDVVAANIEDNAERLHQLLDRILYGSEGRKGPSIDESLVEFASIIWGRIPSIDEAQEISESESEYDEGEYDE